MENTWEFESFISKEFGILYVDLEGIDINICKEIVSALGVIQEIFPEILNSLCAIGNADYITEQINLVANSNPKEDFCWYDKTNQSLLSLAVVLNESKTKIEYLGMYLPEYLKIYNLEQVNAELEDGCLKGKYPSNCKTFDAMIYHEFGHILDFMLRVSDNAFFKQIVNEVDVTEVISMQAGKSASEAVADAFAEYLLNPEPNEVIVNIVSLINYLYHEQVSFDVSKFDITSQYKRFKC